MCKLDLHGVRHADVVNKLNRYFFWEKPGWKQYTIITGNSNEMKQIVTEWLQQHEYKYYISSHNLGEIQVSE